MKILFFLSGRVDQAWVRGRITRLELLDALEVARIGHHDREFLQLLELVELRSGFVIFDGSGCHISSFKLASIQRSPFKKTTPCSVSHNLKSRRAVSARRWIGRSEHD